MAGEILAQLPEDLRTNEAFTGMNTAGDLGKALVETKAKVQEFDGKVKTYEGELGDLKKKITTDYIPKLRADATDEQKNAYYKQLGVPEKASEYEFTGVDGVKPDEKMVNFAQTAFHDAKLTKDQANKVRDHWNQFVQGMAKEQQDRLEKSQKDAEETMKKELGGEYAKHLELASRFWKKHLGADASLEEFLKEDHKGPLGNEPRLIRLVLKLAALTGEDLSLTGTPQTGSKGSEWYPNTDFKSP